VLVLVLCLCLLDPKTLALLSSSFTKRPSATLHHRDLAVRISAALKEISVAFVPRCTAVPSPVPPRRCARCRFSEQGGNPSRSENLQLNTVQDLLIFVTTSTSGSTFSQLWRTQSKTSPRPTLRAFFPAIAIPASPSFLAPGKVSVFFESSNRSVRIAHIAQTSAPQPIQVQRLTRFFCHCPCSLASFVSAFEACMPMSLGSQTDPQRHHCEQSQSLHRGGVR
jgi:hypothetical protein